MCSRLHGQSEVWHKARAIEIAETKKNFKQAKRLREELCDIHDIESEISAKMQ